MKYILYVCIVLFMTYFGYFLSDKYRERFKFFKEFATFHARICEKIRYTRKPLPNLIEEYESKGNFKKYIDDFNKTHTIQPIKSFTKEQNDLIYEYFDTLGKSDYSSQCDFLKGMDQSLKKTREKAEEESKKYTDLWLKLGFLTGLAIVIFLL